MYNDAPVDFFDDLEFEGMQMERRRSVFIHRDKRTAQVKEVLKVADNTDNVSQGSSKSKSSACSRASSFKAHGFATLVKTEEDEN
jgi:hypothetical protein